MSRMDDVTMRPRRLEAEGASTRPNRVLWVLLVAVPAVFIGLSISVTVNTPGPIALVEGSRQFIAMLSERRIHAATMVPVTAAFLAGLTGLFVVTGSAAETVASCWPAFAPRRCWPVAWGSSAPPPCSAPRSP